MKKRALVIGSRGQDGRLLHEKLKAQSYEVVGIVRPKLQMAKPIDKEGLFAVDLSNRELCWELLNRVKPDVIFHTAAVHGGKFDMDRVIQIYGLEMIRCHVGISQNIFEWQAKNPQTSSHFFLPKCSQVPPVRSKLMRSRFLIPLTCMGRLNFNAGNSLS